MARRTKQEAHLTRECLLAAAGELFEKQGFSETTVSDIVRRAGTTKGALFHHFENKEALFCEIWRRLQEQMDEDARRATVPTLDDGDPVGTFLIGCRVYLEWAQRPDYQRIVLIDGPSVLGEVDYGGLPANLGHNIAAEGVHYLYAKGLVSERHVPAMVELLHHALNGAGLAILRGEPGVTVDNVVDALGVMLRKMSLAWPDGEGPE